MGAKKKQKSNWNFEESSILAKKKWNKSPIEAKNNTHPHTSIKVTVTIVLYTQCCPLSLCHHVFLDVMLEWLAHECLKMIWPLKRLRITAHGWIQAHQGQCLLFQRSDLEPCLWFVLGTHLPFTTLCSGRGLMGFVQLASGSSLRWQRKHSDTAFRSRDLTWDRLTHKRPFNTSKATFTCTVWAFIVLSRARD